MSHSDEQPPEASPAGRIIAMPADTNPYGDIFGGWLMSLMDSAAGSVAARHRKLPSLRNGSKHAVSRLPPKQTVASPCINPASISSPNRSPVPPAA